MICRLCLSKIKSINKISIFTTNEEDEKSQISQKIAKYFHLVVTQHDAISTTLCQDCWNHIEQFDAFCIFVEKKQRSLEKAAMVTKSAGATEWSVESEENEEFLGWDEGLSESGLLDEENKDMLEWNDDDDEWNMDQDEQEDVNIDNLELEESEIMTLEQTLPSLDEEMLELEDDDDNLLPLNRKRTKNDHTESVRKSTKEQFRCYKSKKKEQLSKAIREKYAKKNFNSSALMYEEGEAGDSEIGIENGNYILEDEREKQNNADMVKNNDYLKKKSKITITSPTKLDEIDIFIAQHMDLQCDLCEQRFEKFDYAYIHYRRQHKCHEYVICCGKRLKTRLDIYEHIKRRHLNSNPNASAKESHNKSDDMAFNCECCNRDFNSEHALTKHMKIVHGGMKRSYKCELCDESFVLKFNLEKHMRSVHENNSQLSCTACAETYMDKQSFDAHMLEHQRNAATTESAANHIETQDELHESETKEKDVPTSTSDEHQEIPDHANIIMLDEIDIFISQYMELKCDLCDAQFEKYNDSRSHYRKIHKCREYIKCCGNRHGKRMDLYEHIKWHLDPDYFKCEKCGKHLKNRACLIVHKMSHMKKEELKFICKYCDKGFAWQYMLNSHIKNYHENKKDFRCPHCSQRFTAKHSMENHVKVQHENAHPYVCAECGQKFKYKPSFDTHMLKHKGLQEQPVKCKECGIWVKSKHALNMHMNKHNTVDVECKHCGQICVSRTAMRAHVQYYHRKTEVLECTYCHKILKTQKSLQEHEAIHKNQILYNCRYCNKGFRYTASMYYHIKRQHLKEWLASQAVRSKTPPNVKYDSDELEETC